MIETKKKKEEEEKNNMLLPNESSNAIHGIIENGENIAMKQT